LADVWGKGRVLGIGCLAFGAASAACALAPGTEALIAARVAQGAAAALVTPASLALIGAIYPKDERARAIGVWAAASALTTAGGPILGGWLTESFGWAAVFWINPPIAVLAAGLLLAVAPPEGRRDRRFDVVGAATLAAALAAIAYALGAIGPAETDAAGPSLGPAALAGALGILGLVAYARWERHTDHPMTPPRLWANRAFAGLNLATVLIYGGLAIMFFLLPFELVDRRGLTATQAGLAFLPFTLAVGILSRLFGGVADRVGARAMLIAGASGAGAAYLWMSLTGDASLMLAVILPMGLLGIAFAVLVAPLTAAVMSSVADADGGLASGVNNAASRAAQLAGVALAAGVAALSAGHVIGLLIAAALSLAGAAVAALTLDPPDPAEVGAVA
jgi:MFS family permease